jgi:predicted murein hydrolase (TIGR00659 family)
MPTPEISMLTRAYLSDSPVPALAVTIGAYLFARWLHVRCGSHPFANPVAIAVVMLIGLLKLTHTDYHVYFAQAQFIHFLLGPAIVALAVPLYRQIHKLRSAFFPLLCGLLAGSSVAVVSAVVIALLFHCQATTVASLAPKSVTAAVAMLISATVGGVPSLTAAMVIVTGITGAVISTLILGLVGVRRDDARGFAIGVASHGIGTARAFQISEEAGAFAGLGMAMNAIVSAIVMPFVLPEFIAMLGRLVP